MKIPKFKAWDKSNKKMVAVTMILFSTNEIDYEGNSGEPKSLEHFELLQFTGIKDRNGKEIYEGDVVESWTSESFGARDTTRDIVIFQNGSFGGKIKWRVPRPLSNQVKIGNIYENPELLENK